MKQLVKVHRKMIEGKDKCLPEILVSSRYTSVLVSFFKLHVHSMCTDVSYQVKDGKLYAKTGSRSPTHSVECYQGTKAKPTGV